MRTKISDLITHKDFRVILLMIGHKYFHIFGQREKGGKNKVALAVELRIVCNQFRYTTSQDLEDLYTE